MPRVLTHGRTVNDRIMRAVAEVYTGLQPSELLHTHIEHCGRSAAKSAAPECVWPSPLEAARPMENVFQRAAAWVRPAPSRPSFDRLGRLRSSAARLPLHTAGRAEARRDAIRNAACDVAVTRVCPPLVGVKRVSPSGTLFRGQRGAPLASAAYSQGISDPSTSQHGGCSLPPPPCAHAPPRTEHALVIPLRAAMSAGTER